MGSFKGIKTEKDPYVKLTNEVYRIKEGTRVKVLDYMGLYTLLDIEPNFNTGIIVQNKPFEKGYMVRLDNGQIVWVFGECLRRIF